MRYFLKRCGFQELGSVGADGKPKRGRYLMSSLHKDIVSFFPPLTTAILNDTALLPIIPLYNGKKTYCNYVYHNSKYFSTGGSNPRNEYRIYLNTVVDNNCYYICSEDIVIMRMSETPRMTDDGIQQFFYYLDVINDHSSPDYVKYSRIIEGSPVKGAYAIYEGTIDFFETRICLLKEREETSEVNIDKSVLSRIQKNISNNGTGVFNSATFRDFVLAGYKNACAITDEKNTRNIDVVYIRPLDNGGSCMPNNGIALSKTLSLAFLTGRFTISTNNTVIVHPQNENEALNEYANANLFIPSLEFFTPDKESLDYHRNNVFGSFLR